MLHVMKDDFDESPEDILNSINNMLKKKETEKKKEDKEEKDSKDEQLESYTYNLQINDKMQRNLKYIIYIIIDTIKNQSTL